MAMGAGIDMVFVPIDDDVLLQATERCALCRPRSLSLVWFGRSEAIDFSRERPSKKGAS